MVSYVSVARSMCRTRSRRDVSLPRFARYLGKDHSIYGAAGLSLQWKPNAICGATAL